VRRSYEKQRFEYADYAKFGDKVFPRSIRVFEEGRKLLEIKADDLAAPPVPRAELFQHDDRARRMASCERWLTWPSKKVPPLYPPDARASHQQGTVILYALVSGDGRVVQTNVLQSAGASLDEATREAVRQWTYPPPSCGVTLLETEAEISVNYELQ
jgi:TonB family protein